MEFFDDDGCGGFGDGCGCGDEGEGGGRFPELEKAFRDFTSLPFPRVSEAEIKAMGEYGGFIEMLQNRIKDEDAYVAGLAGSFLTDGELRVPCIELDLSLDEKIKKGIQEAPPMCVRALKGFREYRAWITDLAEELSKASGLEIKDWQRGE